MKRRSAPARALSKPEHRHRVIPNKKRRPPPDIDVGMPEREVWRATPNAGSAHDPYIRAASTIRGSVSQQSPLARIKQIIENVEQRCLAADGPVTPTHLEILHDELAAIYALASGHPETWRHPGVRSESSAGDGGTVLQPPRRELDL